MKTFTFTFPILLAFGLFCCKDQSQHFPVYDSLVEAFKSPPPEARPKVYWWCLNGNIDTARAREELHAMKTAGISGFDLFEIGVPAQDTMIPGGPAFMSDESVNAIKWVIDLASELDLTVGLNLASSWNAGGSWVRPEHGGKSLYLATTQMKGGQGLQVITLPFPDISFPKESLIGGTGHPMIPFRADGRPEYYEDVTVLAVPVRVNNARISPDDIINVSAFFDPATDKLLWDAPVGDWVIHRYVSSNSGQQLVLPSPRSAGLTIDHFDAGAVESHLMYIIDRLETALGDFRNTALKSFYLASYEARGLVWTPSLPEKYQEITGQEIWKFIPALIDAELFPAEITAEFQSHFKKTLSELMIHNLYRNAREICNRYGIKINSEAGGPGYPLYNGPAEPLKAQGSLDIPRGEFWINHSRFYRDEQDSIDLLRVVKEAAAASHIYQKGIVEEEAFTSFQHWQEGPFDMKPYGDRAFCEGMNRVVFHGFSHNITGSGYPGYVYHAGTHFNDKRVWWPKVKPFTDYLSRLSAVFQNASFKADVLWYYGDKVPNSATPKNTHFKVGPGYDYEVINTEILLSDLSFDNGKLVLSNGAEFELLVLEAEESIHPGVLEKLRELVGQGAIVIGERPNRVKHLQGYGLSDSTNHARIEELWPADRSINQDQVLEKGRILTKISAREVLEAFHILPDITYEGAESQLLDYIHYQQDDVDLYFLRNTTGQWLSRNVGFRQENKTPELWIPENGKIIPLPIYQTSGEHIQIPLTLPPYGSLLVTFGPSRNQPLYSQITSANDFPPSIQYTPGGFYILEAGRWELHQSEESIEIVNHITEFPIGGPWKLTFNPGWGAPENQQWPELISWTESDNPGVKFYSGNAHYRTTFHIADFQEENRHTRTVLDLGEISKVGEVWLNGENLGILWKKPYRIDISGKIKPGENVLEVEVANTWSNRLVGDEILGENYTNSNIKRTVIPAPVFTTGDQTRHEWKDVPLIKSGLLGPVTVQKISMSGIE